ncbi:DUF2442 domain-containing protein [Candidatus Accumulibacter aalborgensis]|uniref:DUF2442 domain-containing protein n=1 Tax=Candidatus Accumulibacter aalborgensis TaxID=1860102 RepID=UPI0016467754|nr:DUF2442 domain-containing protein [Candidatus Accumulibacter aalborgensis]
MPNQTTTQENPAAGVTPAAPWRIHAVSVLPDYRLAVTFRDGSCGVIDCSSVQTTDRPGIFGPLADPEFFHAVRIELGVLTWPNGADLDPAWIHENISTEKTWSVPF